VSLVLSPLAGKLVDSVGNRPILVRERAHASAEL
jgi:hypothetical protein